MCGRFTLRSDAQEIARHFRVEAVPGITPRYNVAPSQDVAIVRLAGDGGREADLYRWGLIPSWAKDSAIGNKLINARSETVAEKPTFREAYKRRRCLVIADGFFEWQKLERGGKQPYYFKLKDDQPFAFTGLYEHWSLNEKSYQVCWGAMIASIYKKETTWHKQKLNNLPALC